MPAPLLDSSRARFFRVLIPVVVALGLSLSTGIAWQAEKNATAADALRFQRLNDRIQSEITRRVHLFEYGLRGTMALWPASKSVERGEFKNLFGARDLPNEFPGALGLGFIKRVARADLPAFLAATRADDAPEFQVKTSGDAADLLVIEFIEPLAQNQAAQGFDVGQEPKRRAAAERAMLTGKAALTEPITLMQAKDEGSAFLYYYPVYKNGTHPVTPEERRAALFGWTYMPIVASRIFANLNDEVGDELDFDLFNGESLEPRQKIYDGDKQLYAVTTAVTAQNYRDRQFNNRSPITVGGVTWTLVTSTTPKFVRCSRTSVYSAAMLGPLLTLMLVGLLLNLGRTHRKAQALATAMTSDLAATKQHAERLALVATRTTNAIVFTDAQRRITWVNDGFTRITGYTFDEAMGQSPGQLLQSPRTDPAVVAKMRAALHQGEGFRGEVFNRSKASRDYWIDINIIPLHDAGGQLTGFMAIELDITERKQADAALKEQAERTELALESGGLGLWDWNIATGETRFDKRWAAAVGEDLANLRPHVDEWVTRCHTADMPIAQAALERHFAGETPLYQCRHRLKNRRGHWMWVMAYGRVVSRSADGKPLRIVGTSQDITSTQLAQLEVERHVTALNHTSRLAKVGAWELDVSHQILTWSEQVRAIHEVDSYYEPTLASATAFYEGAAAASIQGLVQAAIDHGTSFDVELPLISAQGNHLWVRVVGEAQRFGDTTTVVRGALQDITEAHRQREALSQAKDAAEAAARTKAEFLANMSHEIRTPMSAVLGMSELLKDSPLTPEQARYVSTITTSGTALLTLINDILDFSKFESGQIELEHIPVNLRACVESARELCAQSATRKGLPLHIDIAPEVPTAVYGDITRLRQIMINLVSNAVKFTAKGEVRIALTMQPDKRLRVAVHDTGIGIPEDRLDRLFKSFSQVDSSITRNFGGTGLGLAICQRLVSLMDGRIWAESTAHVGSIFQFEIPCNPAPITGNEENPPVAAAAHALLATDETPALRILLAEDIEINQQVATLMLGKLGYTCAIANNGVEALEAIAREPFDLLFLDMQMPEMDGLTCARELRAKYPLATRPWIVAMTANALEGDREKCLEAGMDDYISKPISGQSLSGAIARTQAGLRQRRGE